MRLAILLALTLLPVHGAAQNPAPPGRPDNLLSEFTNSTPTLQWYPVLDGVMGGRSSGTLKLADGRLTFSGTLNTNGGGFASLRTRPAALRLAAAEGVRVRVRGDAPTYPLLLPPAGDGRARSVSYRAEFRAPAGDAWRDVWLPFDAFVPMWRGRRLDLPPIDQGRIDSLGLMIADGVDGAFHLEADAIHSYGPFELGDLIASRRPLVLFAPKLDDERLATQLADLAASKDAFSSREGELLLVLEEGPSRAGDRPLSDAAATALREQFEVEPGAFALRLIGKDGSVKRAATAPVAMADLYALIDSMPMRRAEIERSREPNRTR